MGEFPKTALIRAHQFHFNQRNVRAFVVVKVINGFDQGGGGKFIHVQLVLVPPVDVIDEQVGHNGGILHKRLMGANERVGVGVSGW